MMISAKVGIIAPGKAKGHRKVPFDFCGFLKVDRSNSK